MRRFGGRSPSDSFVAPRHSLAKASIPQDVFLPSFDKPYSPAMIFGPPSTSTPISIRNDRPPPMKVNFLRRTGPFSPPQTDSPLTSPVSFPPTKIEREEKPLARYSFHLLGFGLFLTSIQREIRNGLCWESPRAGWSSCDQRHYPSESTDG